MLASQLINFNVKLGVLDGNEGLLTDLIYLGAASNRSLLIFFFLFLELIVSPLFPRIKHSEQLKKILS